jgi:DNA helicase II / ATP-dependent DNA helicase PcrA
MASGSNEEIEEERRVLHVAMTRARDQLHLIHPRRFYTTGQPPLGDRYVHAPRSRFVPEALLALFEHRIVGFERTASASGPAPPKLPKVDVGAQLLDLWR